jgi:hypothetical protein
MGMTHRVLDESKNFVLTHENETVFIYCRVTGKSTVVGDHHGDPTCGVIAPDESWFATGGEGVSVFVPCRGANTYLRDPVFHVSAMRLEGSDNVRFLVDPWSANASVWGLNPSTGDLSKLRDGPDLRNSPYQENVPY